MTGPRPQGVRIGIRYEWDEELQQMVPVRSSGFPTLPSVIAGGIPFVGGIIQNILQNRQAEKQMRFQREMSNTAYTRAAKDMRRAGINPLLGFQGPASSPQGAQAQIGNPLADSVSSALQMRNLQLQQADLMRRAIDSNTARALKRDQGALARANKGLVESRATSAKQVAEFDKWIGTLGPGMRFLAEMFRAFLTAAR